MAVLVVLIIALIMMHTLLLTTPNNLTTPQSRTLQLTRAATVLIILVAIIAGNTKLSFTKKLLKVTMRNTKGLLRVMKNLELNRTNHRNLM
jgi:hypothetical protein